MVRPRRKRHDHSRGVFASLAIGRTVLAGAAEDSQPQQLIAARTAAASTTVITEGLLPENCGPDRKRRDLDCLILNECLDRLLLRGIEYDTVRGAFLEGDPVYPGAGFSRETHLQIAVRNPSCLLGVFRPNLPS